MNRDEINNLGAALLGLMEFENEGALIVSVGAHGPSLDCSRGHTSVTLQSGQDVVTSEAVGLFDAMCLARGKLKDIAERRAQDDSGIVRKRGRPKKVISPAEE